jgi:xanthine/CO dehydrogenase XdhC/CoxF family maturation factor
VAQHDSEATLAAAVAIAELGQLAGGTVRVIARRLTDAERQIIFESNRTERRVLVATLHGCVEWSQHQAPGCEEPMQAVGVVTTWDHDSFKLGGWSFLTNVPWESAVRVWWRDEAPSDEEVKAILAEKEPSR